MVESHTLKHISAIAYGIPTENLHLQQVTSGSPSEEKEDAASQCATHGILAGGSALPQEGAPAIV